MLFQVIRLSEVKSVYRRTMALLNGDIKSIGRRTGWHQFIGENKVGDVATGQGLIILKYLGQRHRLQDRCLITLKEAQIQSGRAVDIGAWSFLSSRDIPTIEATVWALLGLLAGGETPESEPIRKGKEWIKKHQNDDGGWGPRKGLVSRTYCTFLAVKVLTLLEPYAISESASHLKNAMHWVLDTQNPDGGWGSSVNEESTAVHTAFALLTLLSLGIDPAAREVKSGVEYLYTQWNPLSMWEHTRKFEQYELPRDETSWTRITFHYFPTPWVVTSLLASEESVFEKPIFESVRWLIRSQNRAGYWEIKDVPRARLWAVHDAIMAITTFIDKVVTTNTVDRMILLDDILLLTPSSEGGRGIMRLVALIGLSVLLLGLVMGAVLGSATPLHEYIGGWMQKNWAWILLGLYLTSAFPMAKFKVISWKEALIGIVLPVLLVLIQLYL